MARYIIAGLTLLVACALSAQAFNAATPEGLTKRPAFQPKSKLSSARSAAYASSSESDDAPPLRRTPPRKIALFIEPTPFTHVSGYSNRFKELLRYLKKAGDQVEILTTDEHTDRKNLPKEIFGFPIAHTLGFVFPLYNQITLTFDLPDLKGAKIIERLKPDLIHVTSP